jgi:endoglycosylceramidase
MAKYFRSWTYWQFKYFDDITTAAMPGTTESFYDNEGHLQLNKVKALARPYAYAICGKPMEEWLRDGVYQLKWVPNQDCFNQNTQLFLSNSFYFPGGFNTTFTNCHGCILRPLPIKGYYEIVLDKLHSSPVTLTVSNSKLIEY